MSKRQKKIEIIKNKTKKNKNILNNSFTHEISHSEIEKAELCKQYPNTYRSFESELEKIFKKILTLWLNL